MLKGKKLHPFVTYADRMERASERHSVGGRVVWARWHFAGLILLHCIRRRRCGGAHEEDAKSFQLDYLFLFFLFLLLLAESTSARIIPKTESKRKKKFSRICWELAYKCYCVNVRVCVRDMCVHKMPLRGWAYQQWKKLHLCRTLLGAYRQTRDELLVGYVLRRAG